MKLYGTQTSPYVRRVRLCFHLETFEFVTVNIFDPDTRQRLVALSPILKLPFLQDAQKTILDSYFIVSYLSEKTGAPFYLSWKECHLLTVINGVNDALLELFLLDKDGGDFRESSLFELSVRERISNGLLAIENAAIQNHFAEWSYPSKCLFCLLDWIEFRQLRDLARYPTLLSWKKKNLAHENIELTDPRRTCVE